MICNVAFRFGSLVYFGQCAGTVWNVPGLFEMCRDCLESEISNSPGTLGNF